MKISDRASTVSRRAVLAVTLAGAALAPHALRADSVGAAKGLVTEISDDLLRLSQSGRSGAQLYSEFERILDRHADMPVVAASVLGRPWRSASAAQKSQFVDAFETYVARKYGKQFGEFRSAGIAVRGARDAGRAGVLVNTVVSRPGQPDLKVDWQISERSGRPRAVNLVIEGISMLANERAEIGAQLDAQGGSIDGLIAALRSRK